MTLVPTVLDNCPAQYARPAWSGIRAGLDCSAVGSRKQLWTTNFTRCLRSMKQAVMLGSRPRPRLRHFVIKINVYCGSNEIDKMDKQIKCHFHNLRICSISPMDLGICWYINDFVEYMHFSLIIVIINLHFSL